MNVLHVIPTLTAQSGGTATAVLGMMSGLASRPGLHAELAFAETNEPILPSEGVCHPVGGGGAFERPLAAWVRRHVTQYDVLHLHGMWSPALTSAGSAARHAGVPYVINPHGMLSAYSWERRWLKKYAFWWAFARRSVRGAAALVATSPHECEEIASSGYRGPVREIPLGVSSDALSTPVRKHWLRERCGAAAIGRPILLYFSRLHPKKGLLDVLLPAFERMKTDACLAVVGGPDSNDIGYADRVARACRDSTARDRIAVLGPIYGTDRWAAFDGADLFALTSQSENFGLVVAEAMARGCPVVASDRVDSVRHAVTAGAGVSIPLEIEATAKTLDDMLADPDGRSRMTAAGPDYVRRELTWDRVGEELHDLYRRVITDRRKNLPA